MERLLIVVSQPFRNNDAPYSIRNNVHIELVYVIYDISFYFYQQEQEGDTTTEEESEIDYVEQDDVPAKWMERWKNTCTAVHSSVSLCADKIIKKFYILIPCQTRVRFHSDLNLFENLPLYATFKPESVLIFLLCIAASDYTSKTNPIELRYINFNSA